MENDHRPKQDPRRGRLYQGLAIGLGIVIGFPLLVLISDAKEFDRAMLGLLAFFIGTGLFLLHQHGERHLAPSADDVMTNDPRPPILYLRSFEDENIDPFGLVSGAEGTLARVMEEVGPFVAVGRPGDQLPPLGASRSYRRDTDWQSYVLSLLDRAALVILLAGRTQGLAWELRQCAQRITPEKLVVLVPNRRASYDEFQAIARAAGIPLTLPPFPDREAARYDADDISGLVHFDRSWQGHFSAFPKAFWKGKGTEIATSTTRNEERIRLALKPVAEATGLPIRMPRTNYLLIGFLGYMALGFVFLAVMGWLLLTGRLD
jgi:hypothetical protein